MVDNTEEVKNINEIMQVIEIQDNPKLSLNETCKLVGECDD